MRDRYEAVSAQMAATPSQRGMGTLKPSEPPRQAIYAKVVVFMR